MCDCVCVCVCVCGDDRGFLGGRCQSYETEKTAELEDDSTDWTVPVRLNSHSWVHVNRVLSCSTVTLLGNTYTRRHTHTHFNGWRMIIQTARLNTNICLCMFWCHSYWPSYFNVSQTYANQIFHPDSLHFSCFFLVSAAEYKMRQCKWNELHLASDAENTGT